jgi:hypothetical protein
MLSRRRFSAPSQSVSWSNELITGPENHIGQRNGCPGRCSGADSGMAPADLCLAKVDPGMSFAVPGNGKVVPEISLANSKSDLPDPELARVIKSSAFPIFGPPRWSLDRSRWSSDRSRRSLERSRRSLDRPRRSLDRSPRSLDRSPRSLDRPHRSLDHPHRSLDRPRRSVDRSRRSLDRPRRSLDRSG